MEPTELRKGEQILVRCKHGSKGTVHEAYLDTDPLLANDKHVVTVKWFNSGEVEQVECSRCILSSSFVD